MIYMFVRICKNGDNKAIVKQDTVCKDFAVAVMIIDPNATEVTRKEYEHIPIGGILVELFPDIASKASVSITQCDFIRANVITVRGRQVQHKVTSISFIRVTNVLTSHEPILTSSLPLSVSVTSDRIPLLPGSCFCRSLVTVETSR